MQKHAGTELARPVVLAMTGIVLSAHALRTQAAAKALLLMPANEQWRLVLDAYSKDPGAFEGLDMFFHERLSTEQSAAIRLALKLGSLQALTLH